MTENYSEDQKYSLLIIICLTLQGLLLGHCRAAKYAKVPPAAAAAALRAAAAAPRPRAGATKPPTLVSVSAAPPSMITELGFTPLQLFAHVRLFPAESWEIYQTWYFVQRYTLQM